MRRKPAPDPAFHKWWKRSGYAAICPSRGPDNEAYLAAKAAWRAGKLYVVRTTRRRSHGDE